MKNLIVKINKNKPRARFILMIVYLLLLCFPPVEIRINETPIILPYVYSASIIWIIVPSSTFSMLGITHDTALRKNLLLNLLNQSILQALLIASIVLAIISVYSLTRKKNFNFVWALLTAFLNSFLNSLTAFISIAVSGNKINLFHILTPIFTCLFLILLILDILYLRSERKYITSEDIKQEDETSINNVEQ